MKVCSLCGNIEAVRLVKDTYICNGCRWEIYKPFIYEYTGNNYRIPVPNKIKKAPLYYFILMLIGTVLTFIF